MALVQVDFETAAIQSRPDYPPMPVGVAVSGKGIGPKYMAWQHPNENNCTKAEAVAILTKLWKDPNVELVFHNAKFDLAVAKERLGIEPPPAARVHDSMIAAFLVDPHTPSLALKSLASSWLSITPDARNDLRAWIVENVSEARRAKTKWGAYISKAPGGLVGRYAKEDVKLSGLLLKHCTDQFDAGLWEAYRREIELMQVLLYTEPEGVSVNLEALENDCKHWELAVAKVERALCRRLGVKDLNFDAPDDVATALENAGLVTNWVLTQKGFRSVSAESLAVCLTDQQVAKGIAYRSVATTCLNTFMINWRNTARATNGRIMPSWQQTRGDAGYGARTGRLSCTPNLMNIPIHLESINNGRWKGWPELPVVRRYLIADGPDEIIIDRDFNSQEMRIFAHYEDGALLKAYHADQWLDSHMLVTEKINGILRANFSRRAGKTLNFGMLYGEGKAKLAQALGVDIDEARKILNAYFELFPGAKDLIEDMRARSQAGMPIRTLGGRRYYCEPPRIVNGKTRTYDYKLINYLVQGSAADWTKQSIINYFKHPKRRGRWILSVHDQNTASVKKKIWEREMEVLKESMDGALKLDCPMLSNGAVGPNFFDLEDLSNGR